MITVACEGLAPRRCGHRRSDRRGLPEPAPHRSGRAAAGLGRVRGPGPSSGAGQRRRHLPRSAGRRPGAGRRIADGYDGTMKIGVVGKGGVGKTTVSALIARTLQERGRRVLAVDTDSNPNLGFSFGLGFDEIEAVPTVPRSIVVGTRGDLTVEEVMADYGWATPAGVTLMSALRVDEAGAGLHLWRARHRAVAAGPGPRLRGRRHHHRHGGRHRASQPFGWHAGPRRCARARDGGQPQGRGHRPTDRRPGLPNSASARGWGWPTRSRPTKATCSASCAPTTTCHST